MSKFEWIHVDTCIPDYWPGFHKTHVQIPVYHGITLKSIKESIREELRIGCVMGNDDYARWLSLDMIHPEEEKDADWITKKAYAAVNRIKPAKKGQRRFFTNLEKLPDDYEGDTVCAFFALCEIEE